jgi:protein-disulfide isomerase
MKNQPPPKSGAPLIIIGLVFLIVLIGGFYWYSTSRPSSTAGNNNRATANTPKQSAIPANAPQGATPPNMKGSPTAVVTIEEFADYQCPQCASVYKTMNTIHATYGSRVKFIYRNFPLTQIHKNAYDASVAAEAAYLQDANKFWDMQNQLFTNQAVWSNMPDPRPTFKEYAQKIGLDVVRWETDVAGMVAKNRVDADMQRGRALNITGTPSIFINGQLVQGFSFDILKQVIDLELQKGTPAAQNPPPAQPASAPNANSNK